MSGGFLDSIKSSFSSSAGAEEEPEETNNDESGLFSGAKKMLPKLTLKQRVIGFSISVGLAALFAILGCLLGGVNVYVLAVMFTLGSAAGIVSTFFIVGPIEQVKKMYDGSNVSHTVIKISCVVTIFFMFVLVYCAAFWWNVPLVSILFCIVLFVAIIIYTITLIPFATTIIARGAKTAYNSLASS